MPSVTREGTVLNIRLYGPHAKQKTLHQDPTRFKVLNWGRRTGKSTWAINECQIKALQKKGRYWVIAPTYSMAKNIYWRDLIKHIPDEIIAKKNESELIVTLINGSLVELKGSDNEDSLRGAGIQGVILDEYAFMKPTVWDMVIQPMIRETGGWATFISTPNGFNHFFDISEHAQKTPDWMYSHATSIDNPYFSNDEIAEVKRDMIAREGENGEIRFRQEYMAEFKKKTGLVYQVFDRSTHLIDEADLPIMVSYALGVDFGWTNPTAAVFVGIDYDQNWYIIDELYRTKMTDDEAADIIRLKMGNRQFSTIVGDSAAPQSISTLQRKAIPIVGVNKAPTTGADGSMQDSIVAGISRVQQRLAILEHTGKPKLYVVRENCPKTIAEFEMYSYPEKKDDHNDSEKPIDEYNHAMDALRYIALSLTFSAGRAQTYKPIKKNRH